MLFFLAERDWKQYSSCQFFYSFPDHHLNKIRNLIEKNGPQQRQAHRRELILQKHTAEQNRWHHCTHVVSERLKCTRIYSRLLKTKDNAATIQVDKNDITSRAWMTLSNCPQQPKIFLFHVSKRPPWSCLYTRTQRV